MRPVGALLLVLLAVGGCVGASAGPVSSPDGSPSATPAVSLSPTSIETPSPGPASTPDPSPAPTGRASPSPTPGIHADPDLEDYLPTSIGGVATVRASLKASEITASTGGDFYVVFSPYEVLAFAKELDVSPDDMTLAITGGRDVRVLIYAYRVPGVPAQRLLDARHAMGGLYMNKTASYLPATEVVIAGRQVAYMPSDDSAHSPYGEYDVAWDGVLVAILGESLGADETVPSSISAAVEALPHP